MAQIDDLRGRIPPEISERIDRGVESFRETHKHPANLAMHGAAAFLILRGVVRILRGRMLRGLTSIGMGVALIVAGNEIEGNDSFAVFRTNGSGR